MGRYADSKDVLDRYPELRDLGDYVVSSAFIYYAEAEVDGLLNGYFVAPFSSNNLTATDLSIEFTYLRASPLKYADKKARRNEIMDRIARLKAGDEAMVTTSGELLLANTAGNAIPQSNTQEYFPVFGRHDLEDSFTDPQQLDDEDSARDIFAGHENGSIY